MYNASGKKGRFIYTMNTNTKTQNAAVARDVTLYLTREQIDSIVYAAARLDMTATELLIRGAMAELKRRAAMMA